jgi:polysaccharide biosynthesis/export protein
MSSIFRKTVPGSIVLFLTLLAAPDTVAAAPDTVAAFGYDIFRAGATPITEGPVDEQYILSPGDEVVISIWGQLNQRFNLTVSEEGFLELPEGAGRVPTNGVTLKELRPLVVQALSQIYAAYIDAENPSRSTAFVDVRLGKIRELLVYVVGEVANPGAYTISSGVATVINLLHNAGGVRPSGSLREIRVRRVDGRIDTIDLYDFLLSGRIDYRKIRIQTGDYIIVPLKQKAATVQGEVRRPMNYELVGDEGVKELVEFAGGFTSNAFLRRSQVRRYEPNRGEVFLDIDLEAIYAAPSRNFALVDRDLVRVLPNVQVRRNIVSINGEGIVRPGVYEWREGMRLADLIERAEGLREYVHLERADLVRIEDDFSRQLTAFSLEPLYRQERPGVYRFSGAREDNFLLREMDEVRIYSAFWMAGENQHATLEGHVKEPGRFLLARNMRLYDLIFQRGGFQDEDFKKQAFLDLAHVFRKVPGEVSERIIPFDLGALLGGDPAANMALEDNDVVRIYSFEQFAVTRQVTIDGLVNNPGAYDMAENLTLEDLIVLAGGLRPQAYRVEAIIARMEADVSVEETADRQYAMSVAPVDHGFASLPQERKTLLRAFDQITIRNLPGWEPLEVVRIYGEVVYPGNYSLEGKEERISSLIEKAGGFKNEALPEGASVTRSQSVVRLQSGETADSYEITLDLRQALRNPGGRDDLILKNGDRIFIPTNPGIVEVRGAVEQPLILQHKKDWKLDDYVALCGGYLEIADKANTVVYYPNNAVEKVGRGRFFRSTPKITPGSVIEIPFEGQTTRIETVEIRGAVVRPAMIQHFRDARLGHYLNLCGGLTADVDVDRMVVHLADGGLLVKKENQDFNPVLPPGSVVVISRKAEADGN